jgi:hypothetical protein
LTELDKTAFLVYSQFFTHNEMMCIQLTEDVRMYRKEEVLDRYEKIFQWMGEKLDQFKQLENKALERFEHSANVMDRFEATAKLMDVKLSDIQRIDNVTKALGHNIKRTVSMTISSAMRESTMSLLQEVSSLREGIEYESDFFLVISVVLILILMRLFCACVVTPVVWSTGNPMDKCPVCHTETKWILWMAQSFHVGPLLFDFYFCVSSQFCVSP